MTSTTRVALVTGGMGGLGTAICKALANDGFTVVANCLPNFSGRGAWLMDTRQEGYNFMTVEADVSDADQCVAMVSMVEGTLGSVDVLVNNAGITRDATMRKMDKSMWDAVMSTNLDSMFYVTKPVLEGMSMRGRGWGRIINLSSVNGTKGQYGQTNYSAAKAGVIGFTKSLALEVAARGITVNAIAPGYFATDMVLGMRKDILDEIIAGIPACRLGKPSEIGDLCAYLASDKAAYITGATININGGIHMQ